jgi:hypothetical protein
VRPGRRCRVDDILEGQPAVVRVNIRTLRQRRGWSQAKLGELMGWQSVSTVRRRRPPRRQAARFHQEGNRAASRHLRYHLPAAHDAVRNCGGHRPAGFACLACGAAPGATARRSTEGAARS